MTETDVLELLEKTGALLSGHFELRSGLHSNRFFQCANALRYPDAAEALCRAVVARLPEQVRATRIDGVIAPALGGVIVGHEVARALGVKSIFAEKQDDRLVLRRFAIAPGERYVVAEDVITRGGRVQETLDIVTGCGGDVAAVTVLVDRSGGTVAFDAPLVKLLSMTPEVWDPEACPMCRDGDRAVHPGS